MQATRLVPESAYENLLRSSYQHTLSYLQKLEVSHQEAQEQVDPVNAGKSFAVHIIDAKTV